MKRFKHSLSNYKLFSMDQGPLVPCGSFEVLPGDTVQQATSALVRVSPLVTPVMHPVHSRIHHFFVPYRLLWENWEDFITGGDDGNNASVFPTVSIAGGSEGDLSDYLGVAPDAGTYSVSALPFRAYALIWNELYRDQDLETKLTISTADGVDSTTSTTLQNVCWEKDYFTASRPFEQKGSDVTLPLGTTAPVQIDATATTAGRFLKASDQSVPATGGNLSTRTGTSNVNMDTPNVEAVYDPAGTLEADLSSATGATVNSVRLAMALQRYKEARARYGSRYTEYLAYLGVQSADSRLQRPEYLGGGKQTIQFSEVLQTGVDSTDEGVGNLKGHGIAGMRSNRYRRHFTEHGIVMSFMSVKPKTMYAQGLRRDWSRTTKEEFWQKELEHIGQQAIKNKEVYLPHATPDGEFGYQDRYDEYRRIPSSIAGEFRSTLDSWHMARIFSSDPALNATFVKSNPTDRIYASTVNNQLLVMASHSIQARRLVTKRGNSYIF